MVKITVPASSANLGAGFDALGIALSLYNTVWIDEGDGTPDNPTCDISSCDDVVIPTDETNLIYQTAKIVYDRVGAPFKGLKLIQKNDIPMTRGLGSSSACLVAGLIGANTLLGSPLGKSEICDLAAKLEGHPDNTAPALLGGLVTAVMGENRVHTVSVPVSEKFKFAVFIPSFELKTEVARKLLPDTISRQDAVYNLSRAALMTASLFSGNLENLRVAVGDRIHQPYRLPLIDCSDQIFYIAYNLGAYAVCISGAGPSILAIIDKNDAEFESAANRALKDQNLHDWHIKVLECDAVGATVKFEK